MKSCYFFMLIVVMAVANPAIGQDFTNVEVNHITAGSQNTDGGNSIAVYGNNVYLLWQEMENSYCSYISKSTDGGLTFNDGIMVGVDAPQIFGAITTDDSGSVYVVWDGIEGESINGVYFAKSIDEAATFTTPLTISADGVFPQISVYGNYVYISFYYSKADSKIGFFFARSTNGGDTFETPYEITDALIDDIKWDSPNAMTVDTSGNIYCVWNDGRRDGTGTDIYLAKSTNNGVSFGTNIMVNDVSGSSDKLRTAPSVAVDGSNIYAVWRQEDDQQGNNRRILFSKSTNSGESFGSGMEIASGGWGSPALTTNSTGDIYIAYPQYTGEQNGLFCTKSNDQGATFHVTVTVFISDSNVTAKNPSIYVDGNDILYAVWTVARDDNEDDVCFAKGTICITDINDEELGIPAQYEELRIPAQYALFQNYPNPFNLGTVISYQIPVNSDAILKVFNILGNEIATLVNEPKSAGVYEVVFNPNSVAGGLSSGIYFYKLQAGGYTSVKKLMLLK